MHRSEPVARSAGVGALVALLELRDGYAAADVEHMVDLACAVGQRLGLAGGDLEDLRHAASLHDLGKIGVPDRILHKPGSLAPEERLVLERHPVWGAETLARFPGLERVAELVRHHHERWDGGGYPAGLAGERTPLGARIVGACEAYRALTSDRPYRRSLEPARALAVVRAAAGRSFDPAVVRALTDVLAERGIRPAAQTSTEERADRFARPAQLAATAAGLRDAYRQLDALPALPETRERLVALLRRPRPSAADLVAAIEADPALTIAVLRLANGQAAHRARIGGIPEAVRALTPAGVEILATRLAVAEAPADATGAARVADAALRLHALATKGAVDRLAAALGVAHRDELIVAALLHDVGKPALALAHPGYPDDVHAGARTPEQRVLAERHRLGLDHVRLDALVAGHATGEGPRPRATGPCPLTRTQLDVVRKLAEGKVYKNIARELGVSPSTVRSHLHDAYGRLGVTDRAQAVLLCSRNGWI